MQTNWDDLRLFLAVAREASLSGAGKVLRLDPATLGRRNARLSRFADALSSGLRTEVARLEALT